MPIREKEEVLDREDPSLGEFEACDIWWALL